MGRWLNIDYREAHGDDCRLPKKAGAIDGRNHKKAKRSILEAGTVANEGNLSTLVQRAS